MSAERRLLPRDIRFILDWAEKWKAIPTRKAIAREVGVSEATVTRIVRDGGYIPPRVRRRMARLASQSDAKHSLDVPRVARSELNESHQGDA